MTKQAITMQNVFILQFLAFAVALGATSSAQLQVVATSNSLWSGVATTPNGRIFVCFHHLQGDSGISVAEILSGNTIVPYPNAKWNNWKSGDDVVSKFVRVNVLRIAPDGLLWIIDTGTPLPSAPPLSGGACKLIAINVSTNKVVRNIPLDKIISNTTSVDDFRFYGDTIYLTDSGSGSILVLNKATGKVREVLRNRTCTIAQRPFLAERQVLTVFGEIAKVHADQLEISPDGSLLYFQPACGPMYKVETKYLKDPTLNDDALESHVSLFYDTPSTGGTCMDSLGNVYVSDTDRQQIIRISPSGARSLVVRNSLLTFGDALWMDDQGYIWIPTNQANRIALFQNSTSKVKLPVTLYKVASGAQPLKS